jgi:acyl-CoA synthetase (AMP-forming)/AMP-acid ligase II
MGLKKGDGIGLLSWNCLECTDLAGAAMKGGFVLSPFNPRLGEDELSYIINYSEVKALFVGPELLSLIHRLRPRLTAVGHYISIEEQTAGMALYRELVEAQPQTEPEVVVREDGECEDKGASPWPAAR